MSRPPARNRPAVRGYRRRIMTSAVPVLPVNAKDKDHGYLGKGIRPLRTRASSKTNPAAAIARASRKLKEMDVTNNEGTIVASRQSKRGETEKADETLTFDGATRIWRGPSLRWKTWSPKTFGPTAERCPRRRRPSVEISWKPNAEFTQFHISESVGRHRDRSPSANRPRSTRHLSAVAGCLPVLMLSSMANSVATVSATLFGGIDDSLYADFKKNVPALMNGAENTLSTPPGPRSAHMANEASSILTKRTSVPEQQRHPGPVQDGPHHRRHPPRSSRSCPPRQLAEGQATSRGIPRTFVRNSPKTLPDL